MPTGLPASASTGRWSSRFFSAPVKVPRYTGLASTTASAPAMRATTPAVSSPYCSGGRPSANATRCAPRSTRSQSNCDFVSGASAIH
ncbi:MAG: hypothetical protein DCC71_19410 [Proteobacteria bacterium]|nr:MAG: hypothetical protein DCC71_19410 [Pseudomonadota bacterium]